MLNPNYDGSSDDADETTEEKLLAKLLLSNEALVDALKQYEDLIHIVNERRAEERSRKEVRMDRRERELAAAQEAYASNGARGDVYSNGGKLGTSRPSIDRSRSPTPSVRSHESREKGGSTFSHSHHALPQGPRDPHYHQSPQMQYREGYQPHQEYEAANLAPPPSGPHGPRSPGHISVRTRTPSPSGGSLVDQQQQAVYQMQQHGQQQQYAGLTTPNTATPNTVTPNGLHGYGYHQQHSQRDVRYQQQNAHVYGHDDAGSTYGGMGSANGHAVRYYDDDDLEHEDGTPIRPSAKALGKRKVVEPEPTDSPHASDPDELTSHINPSLDAIDNLSDMDAESLLELTNRADNENEGGGVSPTVGSGALGKGVQWPGQKPVQFVYDAAAERTAQRLAEAQRMLEQGMKLNGPVVH